MVMLQGGELFASCRVILQNGPVRFEHYGYRLLETQSERSQLAEVILGAEIEQNEKHLNYDTTEG